MALEEQIKQSYSALKEYFSPSKRHQSSGNPAQLIVFAEHAVKVRFLNEVHHWQSAALVLLLLFSLLPIFSAVFYFQNGCREVALDCIKLYFTLSPPVNQFHVRAHFCEALASAPSHPSHEASEAHTHMCVQLLLVVCYTCEVTGLLITYLPGATGTLSVLHSERRSYSQEVRMVRLSECMLL